MVKNFHKVSKSQWNKWCELSRLTFNRVFDNMQAFNPDQFSHPKAPQMEEEHWHTICWNAAWTAADQVNDVSFVVSSKKVEILC